MSITSTRDQIRSRRRVVKMASDRWAVLSTAGDYVHEVSYQPELTDFQCDTCWSRSGNRKCWARRRVLDFVQSTHHLVAGDATRGEA